MTSAVARSSAGAPTRRRQSGARSIEIRSADVRLVRRLWLAGAVASAGAGIIHLALGPEHVEELGPLGLGFFVSAGLQLGWSALVAVMLGNVPVGARTRTARLLAGSGVAINVAILAAWLVARLVGLPAGEAPWTPEPVGRPDAIAGVLEGALVLGLIAALRGWKPAGTRRRSSMTAVATLLAIGLMAIGTLVAVEAGATAHGHGDGHTHVAGEALE